MKKEEMVTRTIEGFIRKLKEEGHLKYASELRYITAMARYRQHALSEINNKSIPLFLHLIPYIVMRKNGIIPPNSWLPEIKGYLKNIDAKNSGRKKMWFSDVEVLNTLNGFLNKKVEELILEKLDTFPTSTKNRVYPEIKEFFNKSPLKLERLGLKLRYEPGEYGLKLVVYWNGVAL